MKTNERLVTEIKISESLNDFLNLLKQKNVIKFSKSFGIEFKFFGVYKNICLAKILYGRTGYKGINLYLYFNKVLISKQGIEMNIIKDLNIPSNEVERFAMFIANHLISNGFILRSPIKRVGHEF